MRGSARPTEACAPAAESKGNNLISGLVADTDCFHLINLDKKFVFRFSLMLVSDHEIENVSFL